MTHVLKLALALVLMIPAFAQAEMSVDESEGAEYALRVRCSARAIDRYYCPVSGGGWWRGPYWDNGCSVKCQPGQKAVCEEASCDDSGNGDAVASSCTCK